MGLFSCFIIQHQHITGGAHPVMFESCLLKERDVNFSWFVVKISTGMVSYLFRIVQECIFVQMGYTLVV